LKDKKKKKTEPSSDKDEEEEPTTIPPDPLEDEKKAVVARDAQEMFEPAVMAFLNIADKHGAEIRQLLKDQGAIARMTIYGLYGGLNVQIETSSLLEQCHSILDEVSKFLTPDISEWFSQQPSNPLTNLAVLQLLMKTKEPPKDEPRTDGMERGSSDEAGDSMEG
jgi:hypothetical protein